MVGRASNWEDELRRWLQPFLDRLRHKARRPMCPLYVSGLIGPGDRKSVQPMAARLSLGDYDQLHHLSLMASESELLIQAGRWRGCGTGHRRHRVAEEGRSFGWCGCAICFVSRQDGQLPNVRDARLRLGPDRLSAWGVKLFG